ncbi:MAG: hypothetical protein JSV04_12715 [Candidatus Heimdallarchaeota archaeon]|nr:MAG: hypothetical protein JSV04_12715 [Candidatus Heimdallarchaeota archaeon]
MPRGNREVSDREMYKVLTSLSRPLTIRDLMMITNWSQGKVTNTVRRLEKSSNTPIKVVTMKVDHLRGQPKLYIGLAGQEYWQIWQSQLEAGSRIVRGFEGISSPSTNNLIEVILDTRDLIQRAAQANNMDEAEFLRMGITRICHPRFAEVLRVITQTLREGSEG